MNNNIEALEHRYQALYNDYQAGRLDESAFVSEVDALQFQDDWGRYWMIGTQSGSWHYYDGQAWHQADPRDADKLPFMDEQGVYWQRGVKSGDWYYYQPDTGEWIKPSREDSVPPPTPRRDTMPTGSPYAQPSATTPGGTVPYNPQPHLRSASSGPQAPAQSDGELFQDDEGRYWSIGAKTGQWYFYDFDGWHPAHEFQPAGFGSAPQPPAYAPPASAYYPPQVPYQPAYDPYQPPAYYPPPSPQPGPAYPPAPQQPMPQPAQSYAAPPVVDQPPPQAQPVASPSGADPRPNPPTSRSKSGSWYFFDGDQWLKYSKEDDPGAEPPPEVVKEMTQEREEKPVAKAAPKPKKREEKKEEPVEEPVVAELFEEENEPPPEVVDVEIVTVIEAEPDLDDEPEPTRPFREPVRRATAAYAQPGLEDEVRPRRVNRTQTRPVERQATVPVEPQRQPKPRTASDPGRPVAPRKRESAQEPTILVPTESTASNIGSRPASRPVRPSPSTTQQRRARENTMPMEPVAPTGPVVVASAASVAAARRPEGATQPMTSPARVESAQARTARLDTKPVKSVAPAPTIIKTDQPEKTGYTFGDVLRSFPSTIWTFVGGMAVLLIFALVIVGFRIVGSQSSDPESSGLAAAVDATPTLVGAVANETPTTVPTATPAPDELTTPEPAVLTIFTSSDLDLTLEYPENWEMDDDTSRVIFSPSAAGLDSADLKDTAFWVEKSDKEDEAISDLLAAILANFPTDVETLNNGTISIASQTWTSVQIRFADEDLGGQGIATLAVTTKDGVGYTLVAMSPASLWSTLRPTFQEMINSFRFGVEDVPLATTGGGGIARGTGTPASASETGGDEEGTSSTPAATRTTPAATPTPIVDATPVVHVIKAGDTLGAIAAQYGVDIDLLAEENGITDPGSLSLDQELIIPFTAEELAAYRAGRDPAEVSRNNGSEDKPADSASADKEATPANSEESGNDESESDASASNDSASEAAQLGGRIVYPAYNPSINSYDVWMYNIGTGEQTVIAGNSSQPAFNRDGSLLAYRSWDRGTRGIFFRDFVGGRGGQVTGFVEDGLPTWAPDGYSFAFASRREGDRVPRIFRGNQTGKGDTGIDFIGEYVSAFPDGRLVVKGCSPSGDCGLYVMGPEGGNATKISGESSDTAPSVSPDGNRIAFMSAARGATNWEIWLMNADGSNAKRLTENGSNEGLPTWSPDGKSIAFVSDQGGVWAIWAMNADGTNQRKLVNMSGSPDGEVLQDTDNSKGWVEERISWAP